MGYLGLFELILGQTRERLVSVGAVKGLEAKSLVQGLGAGDAGHPHLDDELLDWHGLIHKEDCGGLKRVKELQKNLGNLYRQVVKYESSTRERIRLFMDTCL